ncbi:MAG: hypothetical protein OWV35_11170 [Firmicutes bacterium]|nr:hypothetical protein [Bacillota bacterium]
MMQHRVLYVLMASVAAGVVVGALIHRPRAPRATTALTRHPARTHHTRSEAKAPPASLPSDVRRGPATSAAASLAGVLHRPLPAPLETVPAPGAPATTWALEPIGLTAPGDPNPTLWFGVRTGPGPWQWIPSTLPGALSPALPKPIYVALQLAWDLQQGQAGPPVNGPVPWDAIAGHVGLPAGWALRPVPAALSPFGQPTVQLIVWSPSETGIFSGYYGLETLWDAANARTGNHALAALLAAPGPLARLTAPAPAP